MHGRDLAVGVLVLLLVLAGCSGGDPGSRTPVPRTGGVSLSFTQLRIDEGTDRAQLRVVNPGPEPLRVTGIGLDWPGYGRFVTPYSTTVEPGRTLDLRLTLPEPRCTSTDAPVRGVVEADGRTVEDVLDVSGTGFVTRIWQRRCAERRVQEGVGLSYQGPWRYVGAGAETRLVGSLRVERRASEGRIEVVGVQGTVIFDLALPRRAVLEPGARVTSVPLAVSSFRCDDHAVGESSQTFHFRTVVRFGDEPPVSVLLLPGQRLRDLGQGLVTRVCG